MKWHSAPRRSSKFFSSLFVTSPQRLRINAGHSFTAHTLRFVLQGGVDSGKVHPRMPEWSSVEYFKFFSTTEIKNLQSTQSENKNRIKSVVAKRMRVKSVLSAQIFLRPPLFVRQKWQSDYKSMEKSPSWKAVMKFPLFYGNRTFITAFTKTRNMSLNRACSIQFKPHSISSKSISILF